MKHRHTFFIGFLCPTIQIYTYLLKIGCIYPWIKNAIISTVYMELLRLFLCFMIQPSTHHVHRIYEF